MLAQQRVSQTVAHIRSIEVNSMKDVNQRRRILKENEISVQQSQMKSQKEFEHLRELQLCKVKHMSEVKTVVFLIFPF
jgi:hypothetical protein